VEEAAAEALEVLLDGAGVVDLESLLLALLDDACWADDWLADCCC
jgi:hypothetical protein